MDNSLIVVILAGIVILGIVWLLLRGRGDAPALPAKPEAKPVEAEKPAVAPEPPVVSPPAAVAKVAAKPAVKAKAPARKPVAAKKPAAAKKATAPKKPAAAKPAPMTAIGVPGAVGAPDNLLLLKGVGPKLNTLLVGLGVTRFDQIGGWSADDVAKVNAHLGNFAGRIERDNWVEQAGLLARGAIAEFEAKFGKLDSEN